MPLPTFAKLSPHKKQRLLAAAVDEFSKHPYDRVSVFEIARSAEISRSSFYYYFADKEDLYSHLLNQLRDEFLDSIPEEIDLLAFPTLVLDFFAAQRESDRGEFVARLFDHTQMWAHHDFARMRTPKEPSNRRINIRDRQTLETLSAEDKKLLSFIFWECSCNQLSAYYRREITHEQLHTGMRRVIELFHYGIYGRQNKEGMG